MPDNDNNYAARKASEADNERFSRISHEENTDNVSKTSEQDNYQPNQSVNSSTDNDSNSSIVPKILNAMVLSSFAGGFLGIAIGALIPGVGTLIGGIVGAIAAPLVIGASALVIFGIRALIKKVSSFFSKTDSTQEDANIDNNTKSEIRPQLSSGEEIELDTEIRSKKESDASNSSNNHDTLSFTSLRDNASSPSTFSKFTSFIRVVTASFLKQIYGFLVINLFPSSKSDTKKKSNEQDNIVKDQVYAEYNQKEEVLKQQDDVDYNENDYVQDKSNNSSIVQENSNEFTPAKNGRQSSYLEENEEDVVKIQNGNEKEIEVDHNKP